MVREGSEAKWRRIRGEEEGRRQRNYGKEREEDEKDMRQPEAKEKERGR